MWSICMKLIISVREGQGGGPSPDPRSRSSSTQAPGPVQVGCIFVQVACTPSRCEGMEELLSCCGSSSNTEQVPVQLRIQGSCALLLRKAYSLHGYIKSYTPHNRVLLRREAANVYRSPVKTNYSNYTALRASRIARGNGRQLVWIPSSRRLCVEKTNSEGCPGAQPR